MSVSDAVLRLWMSFVVLLAMCTVAVWAADVLLVALFRWSERRRVRATLANTDRLFAAQFLSVPSVPLDGPTAAARPVPPSGRAAAHTTSPDVVATGSDAQLPGVVLPVRSGDHASRREAGEGSPGWRST